MCVEHLLSASHIVDIAQMSNCEDFCYVALEELHEQLGRRLVVKAKHQHAPSVQDIENGAQVRRKGIYERDSIRLLRPCASISGLLVVVILLALSGFTTCKFSLNVSKSLQEVSNAHMYEISPYLSMVEPC